MSRVEITLDDAEIDRLLRSPAGDVYKAVRDVVLATRNFAVSMAPVDDGPLRASLRTKMEASAREVKGWVYSDLEYALYVHEGTGIYGPKGQPIRPKNGRFLVFEARNARTTPRGRGNIVFARQVRGQRPQRFLLEALRAASPWPVDDTVIYT
jgi:hypothetical protein